MFSKKATKIDEIFTANLTFTTLRQIDGEDFIFFVAFLQNINCTVLCDGCWLWAWLISGGWQTCIAKRSKVLNG